MDKKTIAPRDKKDSLLAGGSFVLTMIASLVASWVSQRKLNKTIEEIVDKKMKTK